MNAPANPQVFMVEIEDLRRERDELRAQLEAKTVEHDRLRAQNTSTISGLRRLLGEAKGEFKSARRKR